MPTYSFGTLAELWEGLANSLSGRTEGNVSPPVPFASWGNCVVSLPLPLLRVRCPAPGAVDHDFETAAPANDFASLATFLADPKSRRAIVGSADPAPAQIQVRGMMTGSYNVRNQILDAVWDALRLDRWYQLRELLWSAEPNRSTALQLSIYTTLFGEGDMLPIAPQGYTYEGNPSVLIDWAMGWDVIGYYFGFGSNAVPNDPNVLTWAPALGQFPGIGLISVAGVDLQAIDALAKAMQQAAVGAGTVTTQRGKPLLGLVRQEGELDPYADSTDRILKRLGQAVDLYTRGAVTLHQDRPGAIIGVDAGVMREP